MSSGCRRNSGLHPWWAEGIDAAPQGGEASPSKTVCAGCVGDQRHNGGGTHRRRRNRSVAGVRPGHRLSCFASPALNPTSPQLVVVAGYNWRLCMGRAGVTPVGEAQCGRRPERGCRRGGGKGRAALHWKLIQDESEWEGGK